MFSKLGQKELEFHKLKFNFVRLLFYRLFLGVRRHSPCLSISAIAITLIAVGMVIEQPTPEDGVKFIIAKLQKKGLLKRIGGRKYGEWLVYI